MNRYPLPVAFLALAFLTLGCARGPEYAPVSGRVTLDGKPLAGASVVFQPVAVAGFDAGGFGSSGKTDADGRYTLRVAGPTDRDGAFLGKHRVSVTTRTTESAPGSDEITPTKGGEKVPAKYNTQTQLTFDVPASGTTTADFELKSK